MPAKLTTYRRKRDFKRTREPVGSAHPRSRGNSFVVQKHAARRLHYDFRLELDGVLKSWAVPKGPSLEPGEKRLAVQTEDHPIEYGRFHGLIPEGEYGAGTVELWDRGAWTPDGDPREGLARGRLKFQLRGKKLHGGWALIRMGGRNGSRNGRENWLLIKERDDSTARAGRAEPAAPKEAAGSRGRAPRGKRQPALEDVSGAREGALPAFVAPQLATLVDRAPAGEDWLHEIKLDGYRVLARIERGRARLLTRNAKDWSARFPEIAAAAARLKVDRALLDGEIVALDAHGVSRFEKLQEALSRGRSEHLVYFIFDVLHLDGRDLRSVPQIERKALLARFLGSARPPIRYSEHVEGKGGAFFERACKLGLEGIVSKQNNAPYRSGRGSAWVKVKCVSSQEFVIAGYTDPKGTRASFGALLLGVHDKAGGLTYAGRVGTGFDQRLLKGLLTKLKALEQSESPFSKLPASAGTRDVHWVKPSLVADVAFTNWTRDGILRHPTFHGLREDKPAGEVVREEPKAPAPADLAQPKHHRGRLARTRGSESGTTIAGVTLTHPDRVLYPAQGITKRDLAVFYQEIADWILPHIVERPLNLVRCPEGQGKACFYQKHAGAGAPEALKGVKVKEKSAVRTYLYVEDLEGLISLVQMGVLELHPWGSRVDNLEHPDRLTFDLDPAPGVPWKRVVDAARQLRSLLAEVHLTAFVKTTGGKGLHVVVPLAAKQPWESVKDFARAVAESMARHSPGEYIATASKAHRKGKIFIDYLRNSRGATAVAAYSTRALAGAPVATPIDWDELSAELRSDHYTVENLARRLASLKTDPWEGFLKLRQSIPSAARGKTAKRSSTDE
jgi:bifunctional non-homologous end joining protein LigD